MTEPISACRTLTDILDQESAALTQRDYARVAAILPAKRAAIEAILAMGGADGPPVPLDAANTLRTRIEANQALLRRAIDAQGMIITLVSTAIRTATGDPRYDGTGAPRSARDGLPHAVRARV